MVRLSTPVKIGVEEARIIALNNNFDVRLAHYDALIRETELGRALSLYDTTLSVEASYDHNALEKSTIIAGGTSEDYRLDAGLYRTLPSGTDLGVEYSFVRERSDSAFIQINPSEESRFILSFTQPLLENAWGINDRYSVLVTRIDISQALNDTASQIEENIAEAEKAYWQLHYHERVAALRERMYAYAKDFYELVQSMEELGTAELTDLYAARANYTLRDAERTVAQTERRVAENSLRFLMNNDEAGGGIPLATADDIPVPQTGPSIDRALHRAFVMRRDYATARDEVRKKNAELVMAENELWPELDLEGSFTMNGVRRSLTGSLQDATDETNTRYYAGVRMSLTIEGREERSARDKALYEKARALVNLKKIERSIVTGIDSAVRRVNVYRTRLAQFREVASLQLKKLEEENKKYRYGRSQSDRIIRFQEDYLHAQIAYEEAALRYINAAMDLSLAQHAYLRECGLTYRSRGHAADRGDNR